MWLMSSTHLHNLFFLPHFPPLSHSCNLVWLFQTFLESGKVQIGWVKRFFAIVFNPFKTSKRTKQCSVFFKFKWVHCTYSTTCGFFFFFDNNNNMWFWSLTSTIFNLWLEFRWSSPGLFSFLSFYVPHCLYKVVRSS